MGGPIISPGAAFDRLKEYYDNRPTEPLTIGEDAYVSGTNTGDVTLATNSGLVLTAQVLEMGTPESITTTSTNSVTLASHSHSITPNVGFIGNGTAQNQILLTGANPYTPVWTLATNLVSLNSLSYTALSFVKMSAAGTFILDTATRIGISGTPVDEQVAVFINADTIKGDANLTYNTTNQRLTSTKLRAGSVDTNTDPTAGYVYMSAGSVTTVGILGFFRPGFSLATIGGGDGTYFNITTTTGRPILIGGDNVIIQTQLYLTGISARVAETKILYIDDTTGLAVKGDPPITMTYPGAGIALSTGSAWGTSITNNSANWNTAYGWGDHASAGYPVLTGSTDNQLVTVTGANAIQGEANLTFDGTDLTVSGTRRIRLLTTTAFTEYKANAASWAMGNSFIGSSDTALGQIGAYGSSDTLTYLYIGKTLADTSAKFYVDGAVELYYDNAKKFYTISTGIAITNDIVFTNDANTSIYKLATAAGTAGRSVSILSGDTAAGTADIAGGNLYLYSGRGTGTGASSIQFITGTTLTTGTTLQTLSTKMTILGNGNVGIGTISPQNPLHVVGNSPIRLERTGIHSFELGISNNGVNDIFVINSVDEGRSLLTLDSLGKAGVGTGTPEALLHVKGANTVTGVILIEGGKDAVTSIGEINAQLDFGSNDGSVTGGIGGRIASVTETTNGAWVGLAFSTYRQTTGELSEKVRIDYLGNVGIGTTTPGTKLDLRDGEFILTNTNVAHGMTALVPTTAYGSLRPISDTNGGLAIRGFSDADAPGLWLYGYIGADPVDTTSAVKFIAGKVNATSWQALATTETAFQFVNYGTTLVTVLGNGNVGIGTTTPTTKLQVTSTARTTAYDATNPATWADVSINNPTDTLNAATGIRFGVDAADTITAGAGIVAIKKDATGNVFDLAFITDKGTGDFLPFELMRLTATGFVGIGTSTPLSKLSINGGLHVGGDSDAGDNNLLVDGIITTPTILLTTDATVGYYWKCTNVSGAGAWTAASASQTYKGTVDGDDGKYNGGATALIDGTGTAGDYYRCVDAGIYDYGNPSGNSITAAVGDDLYYNGTTWQLIPGAGYTLQIASASVLGGVKIGTGVDIDAGTGVISVAYGTTSTTACVGNDARLSDARVSNIAAGTSGNVMTSNGSVWTSAVIPNSHVAATVTTTNGLSISGQEISLQLATTSVNGALSSTDWNTFNSKLGSVTAHNLLSATHGDSTVDNVVRGDVITGQGATPKWARLAFPATPTGKALVATATDVAWSTTAVILEGDARLTDTRTPSAHTLDGHSNVTITANAAGEILKWNGSAWINNTLAEAGIQATLSPAALTKVDDTNIILTLGGTPSTALLQAASITVGWSGTLADARITSAATWNAKQTGHANLTSLAELSYVLASFVKMTAAGTFDLDTATYLTSVTAHNLLSATHGDTTAGTVVTGDIMVGIASKWNRLASVSAGSYLRSGGVTTANAWSTVKLPDTMSALGIWVANTLNTVVNLTAAASQSVRMNAAGNAWEAFTPLSGSGIAKITVGITAPVGAAEGDLWVDTN